MTIIRITEGLAIDSSEIEEHFIHASGPGGQNVNKVATAVQLRFDVRQSPSLSPPVRARLERLSGRRLTQDGVVVLVARRHRTQEGNRAEALARLIDLIRRSAAITPPRRPSTPTFASKQRRLDRKHQRSTIKRSRSDRSRDDEG